MKRLIFILFLFVWVFGNSQPAFMNYGRIIQGTGIVVPYNESSTGFSGGGYVSRTGGNAILQYGVITKLDPVGDEVNLLNYGTKYASPLSPFEVYYLNIGGSPGDRILYRAYSYTKIDTVYSATYIVTLPSSGGASLPTVTTTTATNITSNSADAGGNVTSDGGATVTDRGTYWSYTNQFPSSSDSVIHSGTGTGVFVSSFSGLNPNSTVYHTAFATNSEGTAVGSYESFSVTPIYFTLTYHSASPVITETGLPDFVSFKPDGTKCYISDNIGNTWQYSLSPAWDITSLSYDLKMHDASESSFYISHSTISEDGNHLYLANNQAQKIYQYDLSTQWDISTASSTANYEYPMESSVACFQIVNSGTTLFYNTSTKVYKRTLSTPYRISTYGAKLDSMGVGYSGESFDYNNDGTKYYTDNISKNILSRYINGTYNFDLSSLESDTPIGPTNIISISVENNNQYLFIADNQTDKIYKYLITYE